MQTGILELIGVEKDVGTFGQKKSRLSVWRGVGLSNVISKPQNVKQIKNLLYFASEFISVTKRASTITEIHFSYKGRKIILYLCDVICASYLF